MFEQENCKSTLEGITEDAPDHTDYADYADVGDDAGHVDRTDHANRDKNLEPFSLDSASFSSPPDLVAEYETRVLP